MPNGQLEQFTGMGGAGWEFFRRPSAGGGYVKSFGPAEASPEIPSDAPSPVSLGGTDIANLISGQGIKQLTDLDNLQSSLTDQISKKTQYKLATLEREQQIKIKALQDKHLGVRPEGKTAEQQLEEYHQALGDLETNYALAQNRETGKIQPELDQLKDQADQQRQQIQDDLVQKQVSLQTIQSLQVDGTITPEASLQKQWQLAGYDYSLSAFKAGPPTPEEELRDVGQYLRALQQQITSKEGRLALGGEGIRETRAQIADLRIRQIELLEKQLERFAPKSIALAKEARRQIGAGRPSTLAGRIAVEKEKGQPTRGKPIYQRSRRTGQVRISYDGGSTWQLQ